MENDEISRDEIIEMARQAGGVPAGDGCLIAGTVNLRKFAKLVDAKATAREREACAKEWDGRMYGDCEDIDIGAVIRARGEAQ